MRVIEIERSHPTLEQVIDWAEDETIILKRKNGTVFVLSSLDDFEMEVQSLRNNPEFMALLQQWSQEDSVISLADLRKELAL